MLINVHALDCVSMYFVLSLSLLLCLVDRLSFVFSVFSVRVDILSGVFDRVHTHAKMHM